MKTYNDDDGRRRCIECDGYVAKRARRCTRCDNREADAKQRQADEAERQAEAERKRAESAAATSWRRNRLRRYVAGVLATKSGSAERQEYFARHPLSGLFQ